MVPASLEGQTLGKYRILKPLGQGGMARIYRAYHPQLDRYVAVKVLRSDLAEDEEFLSRFKREARAAAALRHPNIVQVFDFDVEGDIYYLVMELLEGDTLKTRLNDYRVRGEKTPLGETMRVLLDVLSGLAYAHSEGMIHRDIKPDNILLTRHGEAVLGDFGIAQIVGGTRHTVPGALMGTLTYMAPEQGAEGHSDPRSDIYSMGIIFYEMLTQRPPFEADTPLAVLMKHVNDPLPLPREIDPTIPKPFERIVLKALAKDPDDRYQRAEGMAQVLHEAAEEAEIELPPRISLPLSFTTPEAPSESVAVFSGATREKITDAQFADGDTDAALGQHLEAERASVRSVEGTGGELLGAFGTLGHLVVGEAAQALYDVVEAVEGRTREESTGSEAIPTGAVPTERETAHGGKLRPLLNAVGTLAIVNTAALMTAGLTGLWKIFAIGWPMELFLVAGVLSTVMTAVEAIWILAPAGILAGNGLIFLYCTLTRNWDHWVFLWALDLWLIVGMVWLTIRLARHSDQPRQLSRALGRVLRLVFFTSGIVVLGLSVIIAAVSTVIGWVM